MKELRRTIGKVGQRLIETGKISSEWSIEVSNQLTDENKYGFEAPV